MWGGVRWDVCVKNNGLKPTKDAALKLTLAFTELKVNYL